ncbi:C-GCAxxG-C-C family protein [Prevotella sp.]|uniref:C-GCAxxG-C-C family protein n=1 Tax=Prevotella sp. TaxID=59823 RepID=UPI002649FCAC|nr:C-GCAxxG-C-C family protein [Prevotella sp.]MDN5552863.1 C-GCAxxG-C-C family protein [Prevotella sp.]
MIQNKTRAEIAADNYKNGYNCGQAVVVAFADRYGLSEEQAAHITAAFGGGLGRQRLTCGAVMGMAVLAGLEDGNSVPEEKEKIKTTFSAIKMMTEKFKEQYGSVTCGEILGLKGYVKAEGPAHHQEIPEEYKGRPCALKVKLAAQIFEDYLKSKETSENTEL